ncbi:MAG: DNA polymerase III subunit delta' [Propionibacteriaceae bacterium]|jgi:DNA polymerase-3 subunit delta'|nr:DNA polymerase III subunit delta' [Propionibacteriaceae bacterium]
MTVWDELVGQEKLVETLRRAVAGSSHAMTHAWLFTGPPGSGRSNAAKAFAAALQCQQGGCGVCNACVTALSGAHPDVTLVRTEQLSIGVDEVRDLVRRAGASPVVGRFQIVVVEDADRVTERGADALLKSLEEPAPRTLWLLCAPTADDVIVTIRSRCRQVRLLTPRPEAVASLLEGRDGVGPELAAFAARVSQGHIGRARALARDEGARRRRHDILALPSRLRTLGDCLNAAEALVTDSKNAAEEATAKLDAKEQEKLQQALGLDVKGVKPKGVQTAMKELADHQKARLKRTQRDLLDQVLTEFTSYFRDVLIVQTRAGAPLLNDEFREEIEQVASRGAPVHTLAALDAIVSSRQALDTNVAPLLVMETLLISLGRAAAGRV